MTLEEQQPDHLAGLPDVGAGGQVGYSLEMIEQRLAPRSDWSDLGASEHFVQFYETDEFLLESLRGFIGTGLSSGEAGIVIATAEHRAGLEERFQADGLDVAAFIASGQYVPLDAAEILAMIVPDGSLEPERFADVVGGVIGQVAGGGRGVRIFGEMVALLAEAGNHEAAIRLEELWNDLHQTHSFSLCCGYPMGGFRSEALSEQLTDVCAEHSRVIPAESYSAVTSPDERLRVITLLQQRANALEAEIAMRRRVEEALAESLRLRDEFLAVVSHDLKTPLTVMQGQAQLLRRQAVRGTLDGDGLRRGLEQIEAKSRRMTEQIDELLDVTRLRAGEALQLDRRMVELVALVQDTVAGHGEAADDHELVVEATEPELTGWWDRRRLGRVVENLVSNAVKYSPEGGRITLGLTREPSEEGGVAVLTVQDEGMGIPEPDLPHIFARHYRGRNGTGEISGTGLGLAGARQIVEQHGGTIAVESEEGIGSTFTVRLPIYPPLEATIESPGEDRLFPSPWRPPTQPDP